MLKAKAKGKSAAVKTDQQVKVGFIKRFAFVFESILILLCTLALLWLLSFVDIPELIASLPSNIAGFAVSELLIYTSITALGFIIWIIRYCLFLRKKMKQQFLAEEEIKQLAFFDRLTNLPNEDLCYNRLEHALARASRSNSPIAILSVGIGGFNSANDQLGHDGGDKLLKQIAKRLSGELRSGDTLARISGVEFLIILETVENKETINVFAEKLVSKLSKCYRISMREVYVTSNMGIALYPSDGEHSKELVKHADTSMRYAKEQGRNRLAFFSKELQAKVDSKNKIAGKLRSAIENNELVLHYQPIISTNSQNIMAVEALLRWKNEELGDITPNVFIPIAEEIGIISEIGDWVLNQACQQNKTWQQQGYAELVMTINLSVMQLGIINYATTISSALEKSGLEPQYLELEFTENTLMKDAKQSRTQLRELNTLGVSIALDDFGTGYSSIKYLSTFKLNKLKIDGSFINNVPQSKGHVMAVKAIIALAKELNLHITAEGVETAKQHEFLSLNGVDSIQGYHFSRPVDSLGFDKLLQSPPWLDNDVAVSISE